MSTVDWSFWTSLVSLLEQFFVLYPPFPEQAAYVFLPLKGIAYSIGIICAIVVHTKMQIKKYRAMLADWRFWLNLVAFAGAALGYQQLFQINTPNELTKWAEYLLYVYINWNIAFLLFLIVFLMPYDKLKSLKSVLPRGADKEAKDEH